MSEDNYNEKKGKNELITNILYTIRFIVVWICLIYLFAPK